MLSLALLRTCGCQKELNMNDDDDDDEDEFMQQCNNY